MSNEAITWAYRQPLAPSAKFVLVALADLADEAHSCYPGQAKLAAMTGHGERTVRRQILELELAGFLSRQRRFDGAGHRTSDRYVLPVGLVIPTGQSGHRPNQPAATAATGQVDQSLPAKYDSPTGQSGQVSLREPPEREPSGKQTRARAKRLPDDWTPSAALIDAMRAEGIPDELARRELPRFRDYWAGKPGRDGTKLDWDATWRNWLRRAGDGSARASPNRPTADDKVRATLALAERFDRKGITA